MLLSVTAGLRAKEIAQLAWDRVDIDDGTLLLTETKGDWPRVVPSHPDLKAALMANAKYCAFFLLFSWDGITRRSH